MTAAPVTANVTFDAPFSKGTPAAPRFSDAQAADIVAFLRTLTDAPALTASRE
mgnify:CR=1 FL=1